MDTAYFFTVDRMTVTTIGVTFSPNHVFKHSKPGKELDSFHYRAYHNKKCCVVDCSKEYLKCRSIKVQTDTKALFITYWQTFQGSSNRYERRCVKDLLIQTSILKEYTPHTCRSAATSKTGQINIDIVEILKQTCWKNTKTFFNFFKKEIYIMHQKMQTS